MALEVLTIARSDRQPAFPALILPLFNILQSPFIPPCASSSPLPTFALAEQVNIGFSELAVDIVLGARFLLPLLA